MTRKHFEMFADVLRRTRPVWGTQDYENRLKDWQRIRGEVATMCVAENPRFDRERFDSATERNQTD